MIRRRGYLEAVLHGIRRNPVTVLLGPRQCGKTTLARSIARGASTAYYDLEDAADLARLDEPRLALERHRGLVILDEVQRKPELFELLRVLADRPRSKTRFLLLGSASPRLVRGVSESLAGRAGFIEMSGFDFQEIGADRMERLWVRGGFPRSFLAGSERSSFEWRTDFIKAFLERDIPQLGITIPAHTLRRFWTMIAHFHGQVWNAADFARSIGSSEGTARRYLDILSGAFVVRQLGPWFENIGKRQVKAPKIYVRDSGLLHALLSLRDVHGILRHPKLGASWEGFALEQALRAFRPDEAYFWATHAGAELDLFMMKNGRRYGVEYKRADAPRLTPSMRIALKDLRLDRLLVIHPGDKRYPLSTRVEAVPLEDLARPNAATRLGIR